MPFPDRVAAGSRRDAGLLRPIFLQHVPGRYTLNPDPSAATWLDGSGRIRGFVHDLTPPYPAAWSTIRRYLLRGAGLATALGLLLYVSFPDGSGFKKPHTQ